MRVIRKFLRSGVQGPCDRGHVLKKTPTEGRAVLHSCSMCVESSPVPAAISQTDGLVSGTDWIGASAGGIDLAFGLLQIGEITPKQERLEHGPRLFPPHGDPGLGPQRPHPAPP